LNLDTNVLIYHLADEPRYASLIAPLFQRAVEGSLEIVVSAIAFMEALVGPIRSGNLDLLERLMSMALSHPNVWVEEVSRPIVVQAAFIRADSLDVRDNDQNEPKALAVADCLVLATGIVAECGATLTNDQRRWRRTLAKLAQRTPMARGPEFLKLPPTLYLDEYVDN
jgi:predicted nucleic acid-binding protein